MSTNNASTAINEELLSSILDRLIPANGDLASAGQLGLTPEIVRLSAKQDRFNRLFHEAMTLFESTNSDFLDLDGENQDNRIRSFENSNPGPFNTLITIAYIVYYKDSRVHEKIGWSGNTPQPDGNEMEPWDESVLENIRNRAPFWREA